MCRFRSKSGDELSDRVRSENLIIVFAVDEHFVHAEKRGEHRRRGCLRLPPDVVPVEIRIFANRGFGHENNEALALGLLCVFEKGNYCKRAIYSTRPKYIDGYVEFCRVVQYRFGSLVAQFLERNIKRPQARQREERCCPDGECYRSCPVNGRYAGMIDLEKCCESLDAGKD